MKKIIRFPTTSIGSEPDQPDIEELTGFIRSHRGSEADLITFYLVRSLVNQKDAGISTLCGGGRFYTSRLEASISRGPDGYYRDSSDIKADIKEMTKSSGRVLAALPAPHQIAGSPDQEDDERCVEYCDEFARILRDMRDAGIISHILHAQTVCPLEIERIASRKNLFIIPDGGEELQGQLLEFQHTITLTNTGLSLLPGLIDQYDIRSVTIINPDEKGFKTAMEYFDTDQIMAGGYGTGQESEYWRNFAKTAVVAVNLD